MDNFVLIFYILLLGQVLGIQMALWVIYLRNYRFATLFLDMLPYYPYLITFNIGFHIIYLLIIDINLFKILIILSMSTSIFQFTKFWTWYNDYHLSKYEEMVQDFVDHPEIVFIGIRDYVENQVMDTSKINVIMRHDVDVNLERTKAMIKVERKLNIPSCYYFRTHAERFTFTEAREIIDDIKDDPLFEVGFHYESISACDGDLDAAANYFIEELDMFREICPKLTFVSAHGDKYHNRRLINNNLIDPKELEIISSYDIGHDHYISEIGGNKSHHYRGGFLRFVKQMDNIKELPKGSLVQILVHADWWF